MNNQRKIKIQKTLNLEDDDIERLIKDEPYIPISEQGKALIDCLTETCVEKALDRHIGDLKRVFTTNGMKVIPDGKDTSQVQAIFLTGGACLYHQKIEDKIRDYLESSVTKLVPHKNISIFKDVDYIFSSLGVLSLSYKKEVLNLLKKMFVRGEDHVS